MTLDKENSNRSISIEETEKINTSLPPFITPDPGLIGEFCKSKA